MSQKQTYYDQSNNRLIVVQTAATSDYWDQRWQSHDLKATIEQESCSRFFKDVTKMFLKPGTGAKIIEGGCGRGGVVLSLNRAGYDTYGIDYAKETIAKVKQIYPRLKLQVGSVSSLPYDDNTFDGYWSLGVIEHDYNGFNSIITEAYRVLKSGGYLFITYPVFSPLRQLKAFLGMYPAWKNNQQNLDNFYQFALNFKDTDKKIRNAGFTRECQYLHDGLKGVKEEALLPVGIWNYLSKSPSLIARAARAAIDVLCAPLAGHIQLTVYKKV